MNNRLKIVLLLLLLAMLMLASLVLGSAKVSLADVWHMFSFHPVEEWKQHIVFQIRFPRMLTAICAGAGLALSGLQMQTLFKNPLAGPYVLGISSGAGLGVAIFLMAASVTGLYHIIDIYAPAGMLVAAIAGAFLLLVLVMAVASRIANNTAVLIVGIMFGAIATAIINLLEYFSQPELVQRFVIWSMGNLGGTNWLHLQWLIPVSFVSVVGSLWLVKPMNAMQLGDTNALLTGVAIPKIRFLLILVSGLLTAVVTAFVGPIAFIGMAVPHIVRMLFATTDYKIILPMTVVMGADIMLLCDIIAQLPGKTITLPINSITIVVGAPVVIWLVVQNKRLRQTF